MKLLHKQKGAVDFHLVIVALLVIGVGVFAFTRVSDNSEVTESDNAVNLSEIALGEFATDEHLDADEAAETVEADPEVVEKSEQASTNPNKGGGGPNDGDDYEAPADPVIDEFSDASQFSSIVTEEQAGDYYDGCGVKGGPSLVTFLASDFKQFPSYYYGDVSVPKGGGYHCGDVLMKTGSFEDTNYTDAPVDASLILLLDEGSLPGALNYVDGTQMRVCAEVAWTSDHPGFMIDTPDGSASPFLVSSNGAGEVTHCKDFTYQTKDAVGNRGVISLRLINNAYENGAPILGGGAQSVRIGRVTVMNLDK